MRLDKGIVGLSIIAIIFAVGAVFFLGSAILKSDSSEQNGTGAESGITIEHEGGESLSLEEFNGLFKGNGALTAEAVWIEEVPVKLFFVDEKSSLPVVILQHGISAKKEDMTDLANTFALQGFLVICPDAVGYGELADGTQRTLAEILKGTADNFEKVLGFVCKSQYVDENRLGLCGISLGALTSLHYVAYGEQDIKAVVSFCGTPDFRDFAGQKATRYYYTDKGFWEETDGDKIKIMEESMISLSPYDKIMSEEEECTLFLMCGLEDNIVPPEGNARFYEDACVAGKTVKLVEKEKQGHAVELDEMYAALAFMLENL